MKSMHRKLAPAGLWTLERSQRLRHMAVWGPLQRRTPTGPYECASVL